MRDGFVKVAAGTPKIRVADCRYNAEQIFTLMREADKQGVRVLCLPELCLTGYTCGDLFLQDTLLRGAEEGLKTILEATRNLDMVAAVGLPVRANNKLYNCAAVIHKGQILGLVPKTHIPNYGEFYERRWFASAADSSFLDCTMEFAGQEVVGLSPYQIFSCNMPNLVLGVEICEDLWVADPPSTRLCAQGATLILNLSASDEVVGKADYRRQLVTGQSARLACGYVYADAGEGESSTDLVFGGHNLIAENGSLLAERRFATGLTVSEIDVDRLAYERRRMTTFPAGGEYAYSNYFELELGKTTGFEVTCTIPATTDKEVERVIERRRAGFAELVPHKGPAVKGNTVHMDYTGYVDGEPFPGGSAKAQAIELGRGRMIPGFEEGVLGHQAGDEFDMKVTFPATYHVKDLAGKEATFKVKVIDVCVRQLPALNSDFAKKAGKVDTMEAYRAQIHDQLASRKRTAAVNHARNQVLMMLADAAVGELPDILVENAYHNEMQSIQQQLQMQRMSLDKYLGQVHQTRDEFKATVRKSAERNTRARMALLQIAGAEGLVPTDAELDEQLEKRASAAKKTLEEIKEKTDLRAMRLNEAIRRAADWVIERSDIKEVQA